MGGLDVLDIDRLPAAFCERREDPGAGVTGFVAGLHQVCGSPRVGVIGTLATVGSDRYGELLRAQRPDAEAAATFNIGGPICASVCTVLKRVA